MKTIISNNYKLLLASKNISIPKDLEIKIDNISKELVSLCSGEKIIQRKHIGTISYDNKNINIFIDNKNTIERPVAATNNDGNIVFFPEIMEQQYPKNNLENYIKNVIIHEITHSIDPKTNTDKYDYKTKSQEIEKTYYEFNQSEFLNKHFNFPPEFDAYSKELTTIIINFITSNPSTKDYVKKWLVSSSIYIPILISQDPIWNEFLKRINPKNHRRLKQRVWNDIKDLAE